MRTATLTLLLVYPTLTLAAEPDSDAPPSPKAWMEQQIDKAEELANRKVKPDSPEAEAWKKEAEALIDATVDWDELIQRSLGRHWDDIDAAQRKQFSSLLQKLIRASYRSKLRLALEENDKGQNRPGHKVRWKKEEIDGNEATLQAEVSADRRRTFLTFHLLFKDDAWRMYDLEIDGAGTVRLYKSSFRKIIREQGWDGLISRLQKKLEDVEAGRGDFMPGSNKSEASEG